jgi:hypothetical protein
MLVVGLLDDSIRDLVKQCEKDIHRGNVNEVAATVANLRRSASFRVFPVTYNVDTCGEWELDFEKREGMVKES